MLGGSAGGFQALQTLVSQFTHPLNLPVLVVIHRLKNIHSLIDEVFSKTDVVRVKEAQQDELVKANTIYVNPADYHMELTPELTIDLTHTRPINFSRPSIDVTMTSVAKLCASGSIGVVMTGANIDGANGLREINDQGGICIIQDPKEALYPQMPEAALSYVKGAQILNLHEIANYLQHIPNE